VCCCCDNTYILFYTIITTITTGKRMSKAVIVSINYPPINYNKIYISVVCIGIGGGVIEDIFLPIHQELSQVSIVWCSVVCVCVNAISG